MLKMISLFASLPFLLESIGLIVLAIIVYIVSRKQSVHNHLYRHEIPKVLLVTGIGLLIPGGFSLMIAIMYVCFRVFQEAAYAVYPAFWDKLSGYIMWLYNNFWRRI